MPTPTALAKVAAAAAHPLNVGLRSLTADETELLAEAVDAGAAIRSDSGFEDFINGGALPLLWSGHSPADGKWVDGWAAGADDRREAFFARMQSGDLAPLAYRLVAQRVAATIRRAA